MSEVNAPDELARVIRDALGRIVRRMRTEARSDDGLTWSQESILGRVARAADGMTSAELARAEGVRPQTMSMSVASLQKAGLIRAVDDPNDGRRAPLTLTTAGQEARDRQRAAKHEWLASVIGEALSESERSDLERLSSLLVRLADHGTPER